MPKFIYIPLGEDINRKVSQEIMDSTWLIYPTQRSCSEALHEFQKNWQPVNAALFSMDEFKQRVIFSPRIRLQDEKRLVCLYQAMAAEDRVFFHIEKYPDLIDWGQHFFNFFEELAEECVDAEELLKRMENLEFSYQEWQLENYSRMLAILKQYKEFISAKEYTDFVFDQDISNLHLPSEIKRYVFVNQYYYTGLEKAVISQLEAKNKQVIICYQGQPDWLNETTLDSSDLDLSVAFQDGKVPFELKVYQSLNLWQMALAFLQNYQNKEEQTSQKHFIIDAQFGQQPYHTAFDSGRFRYSEPFAMHNTKLVHFFQIIAKGLENLLTADNKVLVKLDWLLQAIGMQGFVGYFYPGWDVRQKEDFIAYVCKFSENDILYLDAELDVVNLIPRFESIPQYNKLIKDIIAFLQKISSVRSIGNLVSLIDSKEGIRVRDLLSEDEKNCSNLAESFYEALANFSSMDALGLVEDWQLLYSNTNISVGILDLFLTFIKPKKYKYNYSQINGNRAVITNLMDTRNLSAQAVTFLNLVEGELPSSRTPVWLFNEKQRKSIGMKTWDDIRQWERYYFYRIVASAKKVEIYTVYNQDKNVEPSSFINELTMFISDFEKSDEGIWEKVEMQADTLLQNWLQTSNVNVLAGKVSHPDPADSSFFNLPLDTEKDFGSDKKIKLSWYACEHLINNPFLYYLQDLRKLKQRILRQDETLGRKMFGTLLHKYLNVIMQRLADQHEGTLSMKWEWFSNEFLTNNLNSALADALFFYQLPKNYNWKYIQTMISPFLVNQASWFFHVGLAQDEDLKLQHIKIVPEDEEMTDYESRYKILVKPEDNEFGFSIAIRGKADLRLETKSKYLIIDFKTGGSDKLQLMFYAWFYYLIDNPHLLTDIKTAFYLLMQKKLDWHDHTVKGFPEKLVSELHESIANMLSSGFSPATKASNRKYLMDITRADLMRGVALEEDSE